MVALNNSNKPILFCDFDGVLCHDKYWQSLPPEENRLIQNLLFGEDRTIVNDWMRGKYSAETINEMISQNTGIPYDRLWATFVSDCQTMRIVDGALEKILCLRNQFSIILITGNMDSFTRFTLPALKLDQYFDLISNSFYEGKLKTDNDGQIFLDFTDKFNTNIASCFVLDDSPNVCAIFEKLGGQALLVTSKYDLVYHLNNLLAL